jgi:GDP-mannose 6-dehydrogenase
MVTNIVMSDVASKAKPSLRRDQVELGARDKSHAKITIVGMGYVGSVTGACLADAGHDITFAEINPAKVAQLNSGESPVVEKDVPELIRESQSQGRLRASTDLGDCILEANTVIVCVGTPTGRNGDVHLGDLEKVCLQIGAALAQRTEWLLVVITSTVPPGTTEGMIIPRLEMESGKVCGTDFGVVFSPEFLREGSAVADFRNPMVTILGASDDRALHAATVMYAPFGGHIQAVSVAAAETVKLVGNAWHALKVVFANEVGRFCESLDIDSRAVMDIFKEDRRLNVSAAYLNPGFAFGGSCLPKDLRTLNYRARREGVELPVLDNILRSNRAHVDLALRKIEEYGARRITVLGLAFKHGTDDLRESPNLELVERLLGKGYEVRLHDDSVLLPRLVGANREHLLRTLPHVAAYLVDDLDEALAGADLVIVAQGNPAYAGIVDQLTSEQQVLDLVGVARRSQGEPQYRGFLW